VVISAAPATNCSGASSLKLASLAIFVAAGVSVVVDDVAVEGVAVDFLEFFLPNGEEPRSFLNISEMPLGDLSPREMSALREVDIGRAEMGLIGGTPPCSKFCCAFSPTMTEDGLPGESRMFCFEWGPPGGGATTEQQAAAGRRRRVGRS